jgi:enolase
MGFIDPLHPKDVEGWKKLQETLGTKCLLVADKSLDDLLVRPRREIENKELVTESEAEKSPNGRESREDGLESLSCASLTLEKTLSATFAKVMSVRGSANYIMLSAPPTLTVNPLLVDLAVALQCALFRMGAPLGLTSTCLLSRMLQIRQELSARGTYKPANALVFSCTPSSHLLSV